MGSMRRLLLASCAAVLVGVAVASDDDYKDDSKACNKWYPWPVDNLCHENFPQPTTEKLWIILFTSHACYECKFVQKAFVDLAKELQNDPSVGVGVVNCYWRKNYNTLCFPRHKVQALPSLRIIENGQFDTYPEVRQSSEDIQRFVDAKLKARIPCPEGVFEKDGAVQILCGHRFPGQDDKQKWLVVYYARAGPTSDNMARVISKVAVELGNSAEEKMKQRDRALQLAQSYGLQITMAKHGFVRSNSLVNVGAVCCDCTVDEESFCKRLLGSDSALPAAAWVEKGELREVQVIKESASELVEYALSNLGLMEVPEEL